MKKYFLFLLPAITLAALLITGCKSVDNSDPKSVLRSFFELIAKKDLDGAAKLATKDSKSTLDMVKKGMDLAETMKDSLKEKDPMKEFSEVEFGDAKINGDTATVSVTSTTKKQAPADFNLVKENGQWKVDFTMATLMKMGQQQLQQGGGPGTDSIPHMTNEEMQRSMEVADSVLKNMDPQKLEEIQKSLEKLKTE